MGPQFGYQGAEIEHSWYLGVGCVKEDSSVAFGLQQDGTNRKGDLLINTIQINGTRGEWKPACRGAGLVSVDCWAELLEILQSLLAH